MFGQNPIRKNIRNFLYFYVLLFVGVFKLTNQKKKKKKKEKKEKEKRKKCQFNADFSLEIIQSSKFISNGFNISISWENGGALQVL